METTQWVKPEWESGTSCLKNGFINVHDESRSNWLRFVNAELLVKITDTIRFSLVPTHEDLARNTTLRQGSASVLGWSVRRQNSMPMECCGCNVMINVLIYMAVMLRSSWTMCLPNVSDKNVSFHFFLFIKMYLPNSLRILQ